MRELLIDTRREESAEGGEYSFDYYVLIDQMEVNGGFACESYGVKIAPSELPEAGVLVPNITTSISRIDALMDLLTRNFVTPSSLEDIIADWL